MNKIEIDLKQLIRLDLTINEYLTLLKIYLKSKEISINYIGKKSELEVLDSKNYIRYKDDGDVVILAKTKQLFTQYDISIDFDELFEIYPPKTPNGRSLRTEKERAGHLTSGYKLNKSRYLKKVKSIEEHKEIVETTKLMLKHQESRGALNYLNALEAYITGNLWEKYFYLLDKKEQMFNNNIREL